MNRIDFFYDGQLRRFMAQVVRAFSGFQYETGLLADGSREQRVVPCRMASQNKQVGVIMRNNSENSILAVPMITVFIKELEADRSRTQAPGFVGTVQVQERAVDENGNYTGEKGASYTVDRMMPHPLTATIQVDVWTSNELQKHQLFEQIFMAFNVGFDIQSSDNPLDWSALSTLSLENMTWTSRAIPVGTSDEIDVMSFVFKLPMWISPPAKVKQQKLIHQIVTNVLTGDAGEDDSVDGRAYMPSGNSVTQSIVTPGNYQISILGNEITLVGQHERDVPRWDALLAQYGKLSITSQLRLRADLDQDIELDIIGTIEIAGDRPNVLYWSVDPDTLPKNTITKGVDGIVDPLRQAPLMRSLPQHFTPLPEAAEGQRYLILEDMGGSDAWGIPKMPSYNPGETPPTFANAGDIIEYKNGAWLRVFDSRTAGKQEESHYMVNNRTGKQLRFLNGEWIMAVDGTYNPGYWRILL
jgi:hypothetical protein